MIENGTKKLRVSFQKKNIGFHTFKDHVIFEKDEIVKKDGTPYAVYTPYMKKWKELFRAKKELRIHSHLDNIDNLRMNTAGPNLSLAQLGFEKSSIEVADYDVSSEINSEL